MFGSAGVDEGKDGDRVEGHVGEDSRAEAAGAVGEDAEDDPEQDQGRQLDALEVGQAEEDGGDGDGPGRPRPARPPVRPTASLRSTRRRLSATAAMSSS